MNEGTQTSTTKRTAGRPRVNRKKTTARKAATLRAKRKAITNQLTPTGRTPRDDTKMAHARIIFAKMINRPRAEVIDAFIDEVELTPAGASTYYQTLKSEL